MIIKINTPFFIQFQEYQIVLIFKDIFLGKKVQRQLIKIIITMRRRVHYKICLVYRTVKKYKFYNN